MEDEEEKKEEKKDDDDEEEEMVGKRRDEEHMQDSLVVEEGMIVKIYLGPFCHLYHSPAAPAKRFFATRRSETTTSEE